MKITHAQSQIVRLPDEEPLANGPADPATKRNFVTLTLGTDQGIEGIGFTFFGGKLAGALQTAVEALAELTIGEDPLDIEAVIGKLKTATASAGPGGIAMLAIAAVDIALWDIKGKALNRTVSSLLGGFRKRVPTYASGALMRGFPLAHVEKAAAALVKKGFRQMKTQLALPGNTNPEKEIERIRTVRNAIGYEVDLMCDINQRWDVRQAISIGRLNASAMPAIFTHCEMPPARSRSTMTISTERASSMWRNGTMPYTYSPPATGVSSASATRAMPG